MNGYFKSECGKTRADPGSTRWVHNRFLRTQTKLRWVCGLCNVWCKDENGYKCHLEHENHIRKSANSRQSKAREFKMSPRDEAFATSFVQFLALNYMNQKVLLHEVYREMYPHDRNQRLMHDTCWGSLGTFINALSKAGECEAVKGPKGWVVRIDQDMVVAAEAEKDAKISSFLLAQDDVEAPPVPESRTERMQASWAANLKQASSTKRPWEDDGGARRAAAAAREAKRLAASAGTGPEPDSEEVETLSANRSKVAFQFGSGKKAAGEAPATLAPPAESRGEAGPAGDAEDVGEIKVIGEVLEVTQGDVSPPASPAWPPGLVVKVLCPDALGGKACGVKAVTQETDVRAGVAVRLLKPIAGQEQVTTVKPDLLETVLPKFGSRVLVLRPGGNQEGTLQSVETETFTCTVVLNDGRSLAGLPYDRVCKIWTGN